MSTTTTNLGLIKPDLTDPADITQMNANWDKLDTEMITRVAVTKVTTANTNLNDYKNPGVYFFTSQYTPIGIPVGVNGWLVVLPASTTDTSFIKQIWLRAGTVNSNDYMTFERSYISNTWGEWTRYITEHDITPIEYGTSDLTAGESALETGKLYFVYE